MGQRSDAAQLFTSCVLIPEEVVVTTVADTHCVSVLQRRETVVVHEESFGSEQVKHERPRTVLMLRLRVRARFSSSFSVVFITSRFESVSEVWL